MTKTEWRSYHEAYNLVRGLCMNERQHKNQQEVQNAVKHLHSGVDHYLNYVKRMRVRIVYLMF